MRMPKTLEQANDRISFFGTPDYASKSGLECLRCTFRDDLESLCYRCACLLLVFCCLSAPARAAEMYIMAAQLLRDVDWGAALAHPGGDALSSQWCAPTAHHWPHWPHAFLCMSCFFMLKPLLESMHPAHQAYPCADTCACLAHAATGYTEAQLCGIMVTREELWRSECMRGRVPHFLRSWRRYVLSMGPLDAPDYNMLRRLLFDCTREAAHDPRACRAEAWEVSPGLEGMSDLLAATPHASPIVEHLRDQAPCRHVQRHGEQTPKLLAPRDPIAAGAPGLQRLPRNKRMRPGSDAAQPDAWDAVAKRLCSEAFATELAHEE